jgi:hypothetical protein
MTSHIYRHIYSYFFCRRRARDGHVTAVVAAAAFYFDSEGVSRCRSVSTLVTAEWLRAGRHHQIVAVPVVRDETTRIVLQRVATTACRVGGSLVWDLVNA